MSQFTIRVTYTDGSFFDQTVTANDSTAALQMMSDLFGTYCTCSVV